MRHKRRAQRYKTVALLLSFVLILSAGVSGTLAQIFTKTPSFINTFFSGLDPTGDIVIRKEVSHPFGAGYTIPTDLQFAFTVSLGNSYAGKTVKTSQGEMVADENGNITVTVSPAGVARILDILEGTVVSVKEQDAMGFTPSGGAEQSITVQSGENRVVYTNTYMPGLVHPVNVTVSGTKLLEGRDWQSGDSFTFRLEYKLAGTETWQSAGTTSVSYDPANPDFNKFSFTDLVQGISYSAAGIYSFRVSEVEGTLGGVAYDQVVSYFDVTVGDADMNGFLEIQDVKGYQNAAATYDASAGSYHVYVTVNNKYAPAGTATAVIKIDKQVLSNSGEGKSSAGYTFELYDEGGNLVAISDETSAAGEATIELVFEAKNAGETFHYILKETHGGETLGGLTYADTVYPVSVSIVDNLDGTICAYVYDSTAYQTTLIETEPEETEQGQTGETEPTETGAPVAETAVPETRSVVVIPNGASNRYAVSFVNIYDPADTAASFDGIKTLEGRDLKAGEFVFDLYATDDVFGIAAGQAPIESVTNNAAGEFSFAAINYDEVGVYYYVIKQNTAAKLGGVTYDDAEFYLVVTVTDENGTLKATTSITNELGAATDVKFQNSYKAAPTAISLSGSNTLTGAELTANMFQYHLYKADENYTIQGAALAGVSNDANGQFAFENIPCNEPGTFYYVVRGAASATEDGMTYDDTEYGVQVFVWDDGDGVLRASYKFTKISGGEVDEIRFEHNYAKPVEPTDPSSPTGSDDPTKPSDPAGSDDPAKPSDPAGSDDPVKPSDPMNPSEDTDDPTKPTTPVAPDVPQTGDNSPIALYIVMCAMSFMGMALLIVLDKINPKSHDLHE